MISNGGQSGRIVPGGSNTAPPKSDFGETPDAPKIFEKTLAIFLEVWYNSLYAHLYKDFAQIE